MKTLENGFVLHRVSYSETSWVIRVFTRKHGLKAFLVQGGKKKYASLIQAMSPIEFTYNLRHEDQLSKMYDLRAFMNIPEIRFDPVKASVAFFQAEVLLQCLEDGMIDEKLFRFLEDELLWLNANPTPANYLLFWLLELSSLLGFKPHSLSEAPSFFDMENGELVDVLAHGSSGQSGEPIVMLHQFLDLDRSASFVFPSSRDQRNALLEVLLHYFSVHIPRFRKIKCLEVYQSIRSEA